MQQLAKQQLFRQPFLNLSLDQTLLVINNANPDATVYTDDLKSYQNLPSNHKAIKHSVSQYVEDQVHTNGIESFWSLLKRGYHGTSHESEALGALCQ